MKHRMEMPSHLISKDRISSYEISSYKAIHRNLFVVSTALMRIVICSALTFVSAMTPATAGDCPTAGTWSSACTVSNSSSPLTGPVNITSDLTIPADVTVTIGSSHTLTVAAGKTLINNGTITVDSSGTLAISSPSSPTQAAVLVNPGEIKVNSGGNITGGGFIWNANPSNTAPGTLDNSGTIAPVVYGIGFQGNLSDLENSNRQASSSDSCGSPIPPTMTITVDTSNPWTSQGGNTHTSWTLRSDQLTQPISKEVQNTEEMAPTQTVDVHVFQGQTVELIQGDQTGGGGTYFLSRGSYNSSITSSTPDPTLEVSVRLPQGRTFALTRLKLNLIWLGSSFGSVGDLNMDLCTGTWAVSGPDSSPPLDPSNASEWNHVKVNKGASGYELSLSPYTAAVDERPVLSGGLIVGPSGFTVVPDGINPSVNFAAGKDDHKGPYIKMGNGLVNNARQECTDPKTQNCAFDYFRKVDLYVRYKVERNVANSITTPCPGGPQHTGPSTFDKTILLTITDLDLPSTPTPDCVTVPHGKNLLVEYVLDDPNISFCPSSAEDSQCPAGNRPYQLVAPFPPGLDATSELPINMKPVTFTADGHQHLFIFDYNNSDSSSDVSYNYKLLTSAGDVDPTIVEKAQPASGDGGGGHDPDY